MYNVYTFELQFCHCSIEASCVRGCIQKFPDWPPQARPANGTDLCH